MDIKLILEGEDEPDVLGSESLYINDKFIKAITELPISEQQREAIQELLIECYQAGRNSFAADLRVLANEGK